MAKVSVDTKFKDELVTIEKCKCSPSQYSPKAHWLSLGFKVLSEAERTTSIYTLLQHSTQDQAKFFMAVLQQRIIKPEENGDTNGG